MISDLPAYDMTSVNGTYMNSGSLYASKVETVQVVTPIYYTIEDRSTDYPPIGQLVPIGDYLFVTMVYIIIYIIIKLKKHDR